MPSRKLEEAPAPARENIAGLSEVEASRRLAQYGEMRSPNTMKAHFSGSRFFSGVPYHG